MRKEQVLEVVKKNGPLIPIDVKRELGSDTTIIGAMLSELAVNKLIKVTKVKKGGSPFYYVLGQEEKLQELIEFLNEKDKKTYFLLKNEKILFDDARSPLERVSLRQIKDFAKSLEINFYGEKRILWKYYLVQNSEVEKLLKEQFGNKKETKTENIKTPKKNKIREESSLFVETIKTYLKNKNIEILSEEIIRASSEIDFKIKVPTTIGSMNYYCKAKSKKTSNDGDLSMAYVKGISMNLPVLFITTGKVTKKAKEMIGKEFKGLVLKEL
jgi:hypothetical protein